jgi:hypothetical protein
LVRSDPSQRAEWRDDYYDDREDEGGNQIRTFAGKDHEDAAEVPDAARVSISQINRLSGLRVEEALDTGFHFSALNFSDHWSEALRR